MIPPVSKVFDVLASSAEYVVAFLEAVANVIHEREPNEAETLRQAARIIREKKDVLDRYKSNL